MNEWKSRIQLHTTLDRPWMMLFAISFNTLKVFHWGRSYGMYSCSRSPYTKCLCYLFVLLCMHIKFTYCSHFIIIIIIIRVLVISHESRVKWWYCAGISKRNWYELKMCLSFSALQTIESIIGAELSRCCLAWAEWVHCCFYSLSVTKTHICLGRGNK